MKCFYHPEIEAVVTCSNCGKAICQTDVVNVSGKIVCQQCVSTGKTTSVATTIPSKPTNSLAIVSIGIAIVGLVGCLCFGAFGSIFGILAAATGYIARKQIASSQYEQQGLQLATIGMVIGMVEAALGIIVFLCLGSAYGTDFLIRMLNQLQ